MTTAQPKDAWDKMQSLAALIASIFVPLAVAFVGNSYANAMKEAENKLRYVELAINILRADPTRENNALRGWAVEILSSQSAVPISEDVKRQLKLSPLSSKYPLQFEWKGAIPPDFAEWLKGAASAAKSSSSAASK